MGLLSVGLLIWLVVCLLCWFVSFGLFFTFVYAFWGGSCFCLSYCFLFDDVLIVLSVVGF